MSDTDLHIRLYPPEKQLIRERAQHHGLSMSEYVRREVAGEQRRELQATIYPRKNVRTFPKDRTAPTTA